MQRLGSDVLLPYSRALCSFDSEHKGHPKQRCAVGRTAFGTGKYSWLFQMHWMNIEEIPFEHQELYLPLYQLSKSFEHIAELNGYELHSPIYADGPFPAYEKGISQYVGQTQALTDPVKQAEAILKEMAFVPDMVRYRLAGGFLPLSRAALPENPVYGRPYSAAQLAAISEEEQHAETLES